MNYGNVRKKFEIYNLFTYSLTTYNMHIGYIGLGKMGHNMVLRLIEKGHTVVAFDVDAKARQSVARKGVEIADSIAELAHMLTSPRLVWIMVPAFAHAAAGRPQYSPVDEVLDELRICVNLRV